MIEPDDEVKEMIEIQQRGELIRSLWLEILTEDAITKMDCAIMCEAEGRSAEL